MNPKATHNARKMGMKFEAEVDEDDGVKTLLEFLNGRGVYSIDYTYQDGKFVANIKRRRPKPSPTDSIQDMVDFENFLAEKTKAKGPPE